MTEMTIENLGLWPEDILSDARHFSEAQIRDVEQRGIEVDCLPEAGNAAEREARPRGRPPEVETFAHRVRRRVRRKKSRKHYGPRKSIVEPVFTQIKHGRGLRPFLTRGLQKVRGGGG
ncbi:MAG: transposase [Nitrososphaerota archaeon]|jgi:hypothetical protein|nr:transposase [Nitrososphaerota archaeon]